MQKRVKQDTYSKIRVLALAERKQLAGCQGRERERERKRENETKIGISMNNILYMEYMEIVNWDY